MGDDSVVEMISRKHRQQIVTASFVLFVILLPVWAGFAWNEHQRRDDLANAIKEQGSDRIRDEWRVYDANYASCLRGDVVREKQNAVLAELERHVPGFHVDPTPTGLCGNIQKPDEPRPRRVP